MTLLDLAVLALAVFIIWETVKPFMPNNLPDLLVALLIGGVAYSLHRWVPVEALELLAVVGVVAMLHQKFGAASTGTYAVGLPQRRSRGITLPPR